MTISTRTCAFIGRSPAACAVRAQLSAFAASDASVLLLGPSGSGKELAARSLHELSNRRDKPFVAVDCGALTDSLADSELFGHVRGAFTGALAPRPGLFVEADGGTLFLDEVTNASLGLQARLLRALESNEIRPVGASRARVVNVRVIAATNRDLDSEIRAGRFREDLKFRLDVLRLSIPSLNERREDIPEIAEHLLARVEARTGLPACLSEEAMAELQARQWPGNARQLRNALEYATVLARGGRIEACHLPAADASQHVAAVTTTTWKRWHDAQERALLVQRLEAHGWNRTATARELGLSRQALYDRLRRHGLQPQLVSPEAIVAEPIAFKPAASSLAG